MTMKSVLKDYTQKSRIFLYPHLGIQRKCSVVPIQTYVSWDNHYKVENAKLVCLYQLRNDVDFKMFEKSKLMGNKLFHDFKFVEDSKGVYIFDMTEKREDWDKIINGKYSKLSKPHKEQIMNFFRNSPNLVYIESFLYPEKYFGLYAELLNVKEAVLKDVGELCPHPDLEKERLTVSVKDLDIINNPS